MSLFFNTDDGVHLERVNATQMAKRGIFVNVKPANNVDDDLENQHKCFFDSESNLEFSPFRKRDGFTKASVKKVL